MSIQPLENPHVREVIVSISLSARKTPGDGRDFNTPRDG